METEPARGNSNVASPTVLRVGLLVLDGRLGSGRGSNGSLFRGAGLRAVAESYGDSSRSLRRYFRDLQEALRATHPVRAACEALRWARGPAVARTRRPAPPTTPVITPEEFPERFEGAFEHAAIGMALVAPDGRWLRVNRALCEILGYTKEELMGKTFQDITHADDLENGLEHVERMLSGEIRSYQIEKRYLHKEGRAVWALLSVSAVRDGEDRVSYFISQVQDITERKVLEEKLARMAYHDPLTGLPNRILLKDRLEQAFARSERGGAPLAILYLDLDGFKEVNDSLGHDAGDRLLVAVARRLESHFRVVDTVARLGGDEFCVLLEGVAGEEAERIAARAKGALEEAVLVDGRPVSVAVSIGVATRTPGEDRTAEQLLCEADADMYRAKKAGRATHPPEPPSRSRGPAFPPQISHPLIRYGTEARPDRAAG